MTIAKDITKKEYFNHLSALKAECVVSMNYEIATHFGWRSHVPVFLLLKMTQFEVVLKADLHIYMESAGKAVLNNWIDELTARGFISFYKRGGGKGRGNQFYVTEEGRKAVDQIVKMIKKLKKKYYFHYVTERSRIRRNVLLSIPTTHQGYRQRPKSKEGSEV